MIPRNRERAPAQATQPTEPLKLIDIEVTDIVIKYPGEGEVCEIRIWPGDHWDDRETVAQFVSADGKVRARWNLAPAYEVRSITRTITVEEDKYKPAA